MTVAELIGALSEMPPETEVVLRDLNGLDWACDKDESLILEDDRLAISTEGANKF